MKVLLDENLDHRLIGLLGEFEVNHVRLIGWAGFKNGQLMGMIGEAGYEVFVTADKQLVHQQNLDGRGFGVVVVDVHPNKLDSYRGCLDEIVAAILGAKPGVVSTVR